MPAPGEKPIIIKRIKKAAHAHHGGVWKLAYADFVTAMMAFFLLLWLLNAVTEEQLEGISNYFSPASIAPTQSGSGGLFGGQVLGDPGPMPQRNARPSIVSDLPPPKVGSGSEEPAERTTPDPKDVSDAQAEEILRRKEEQEFREAEEEIRRAIESVPSLKALARSLLIDNTPEGLRIQIVDQEGLAMFPRGSAQMYLHTRRVLELVARVIMKMPQQLSIAGHTDATRFAGGDVGYTNWELSADRANASRRALIEMGVPDGRVNVVVGKADTEPLVSNDPENASNRRISIVLLRAAPQGAEREEQKVQVPTQPAAVDFGRTPVLPPRPGSSSAPPL